MEGFMKIWHQLMDVELKCPHCGHEVPFSLSQWSTRVRCSHCKKVLKVQLRRFVMITMFVIGLLLYTLLYMGLQMLTTDFMLIMIVLVLFLFIYSALYTKAMIKFCGVDQVYEVKVQKN